MKNSLTMKILGGHLLHGNLIPGEEIAIRVDQTLTQDSTGTMVYLQLEAMEVEEIQTELSVAYVDHNMLQAGFENADDHQFIKSAANKYGLVFSKPGGGICHQVHLEQFGKPGKTLLGSDSHTPTGGALGALAIGAGGLDVAVAMARGYYYLTVPKIFNVELVGSLMHNTNGKDVILHLLKELSVKGGVGYVMEYTGEGVKSLSVTDRATICNMGAELGATSSIFPSDDNTLDYLTRQGRREDYIPLEADEGAHYDAHLVIDLSQIRPAVAKPHSPDAVELVENLEEIKVNQVAIGSCTNSSYGDLMRAAEILKGRKVHPDVDLVISPGSARILDTLIENGALATFIKAGARILESACGPCIGMGQAPQSGGVSVRSMNRNFKGRCGTSDASVYLASPETCAATAVIGHLADPNELPELTILEEPIRYPKTDSYFIYPLPKVDRLKETIMGPNIKPFPKSNSLPDKLEGTVLLKGEDNITTDDICPSNAKLLPYRSNIPHLSNFAFKTIVDDYKVRAEANGGGFVIGGQNYGQGSSREHAALVPLYLGLKAVIAKSYARIHRSNLINSGILPLLFVNEEDYDLIDEFDELRLEHLHQAIQSGENINLYNSTKNLYIPLKSSLSKREGEILLEGGYLNYAKDHIPGGVK